MSPFLPPTDSLQPFPPTPSPGTHHPTVGVHGLCGMHPRICIQSLSLITSLPR